MNTGDNRWIVYDFLLVVCSNYVCIAYHHIRYFVSLRYVLTRTSTTQPAPVPYRDKQLMQVVQFL